MSKRTDVYGMNVLRAGRIARSDVAGMFGGLAELVGGDGARDVGERAQFPEGVRASAMHRVGEYDARRLRSQREVIRDVMLSAAECETWLTLGELRALTLYGEASISAQLRHLRKVENGGYDLVKRHREGAGVERGSADGRGERTWEYRLGRGIGGDAARASGEVALDAVA